MNAIVFTPFGRGKVLFKLPDGRLLVRLEHGTHTFYPEEVFAPTQQAKTLKRGSENASNGQESEFQPLCG